jgi:hypothetical protein
MNCVNSLINIIIYRIFLYNIVLFFLHIFIPPNFNLLFKFIIGGLDFEVIRENIREFCSIPITPSCNLFLIVIVIAAGK